MAEDKSKHDAVFLMSLVDRISAYGIRRVLSEVSQAVNLSIAKIMQDDTDADVMEVVRLHDVSGLLQRCLIVDLSKLEFLNLDIKDFDKGV